MYTQHAEFDPALWALPHKSNSGEEYINALREKQEQAQKGGQNGQLSVQETMLLIYHPDERVLLELLDFQPRRLVGWHNYVTPDLEGVRMKEITDFMGRVFWDEAALPAKFHWQDTREASEQTFRIDMWVRFWQRVLDGMESENLYWNPIIDLFPFASTLRHRFHDQPGWKKVQQIEKKVNEKHQQLSAWGRQEASQEELQHLQSFQSSRLLRGLLEQGVPLTREHAQHLIEHIERKDLDRGLPNSELDEPTLQNIFLGLHQQSGKGSPFTRRGRYREIANHDAATPETWKLIMNQLFEKQDSGQRNYTEEWSNDDHIGLWQAEGWLEHPEIKEMYFQTATEGEIRKMAAEHLTQVHRYLPGLIENYPEWVARQLEEVAGSKFTKTFRDWLEQHPEVDLTALLNTPYPKARRTVLRLLGRRKRRDDPSDKLNGPHRNR